MTSTREQTATETAHSDSAGTGPPADYTPATGGTWSKPTDFRATHNEFSGWNGPDYQVSTQWKVETDMDSPVVADGTVFHTTMDQTVQALDLATGAVQWETEELERLTGVFIVDGRLMVDAEEWLIELDQATGERLWQPEEPTGWVVGVQNNRLYYSNIPENEENPSPVSCYDLDQETTLWTQTFESEYWGQKVGPDGTLYRSTRDEDIRAYHPETGERRWTYTYELSNSYGTLPMDLNASENVVYIPLKGETSRTLALDSESGDPLYTHEGIATAPSIVDDSAYIYDPFDEQMDIIDVETGAVDRQWSVPFSTNSSVVVVGDSVYMRNNRNYRLYKFDGTTGEMQWEIEQPEPFELERLIVLEDYILVWAGSGLDAHTLYSMAP